MRRMRAHGANGNVRRMGCMLFVLALALQLALTVAQVSTPTPSVSPSNWPEHDNKFPAEEFNRHLFMSSDAPLTKTFTEDQNLIDSYNKLLRYIEHIDVSVVLATNQTANFNDDADGDTKNVPLTTCNNRDDGWSKDVSEYFTVRRWVKADTSCISDVYGTNEKDGVFSPTYKNGEAPSSEDVFNEVSQHTKLINDLAGPAAKLAGVGAWQRDDGEPAGEFAVGNWSAPTRARNFTHEVRSQSCEYDYMGFVRFDGLWYVAERITNVQKDVVQEVMKRNFLYEFIHPSESPYPMALHNHTSANSGTDTDTDTDVDPVRGATTGLGLYTGIVTGSAFGTIFPTDNLAVEGALRIGEHQTQQASDATTPSNVAILAFPLVMNVVPVALIADVNSLGMLVYTLLTDVLTAVPLAIKGIEVLDIGRRSNSAAVTRITGANTVENSTNLSMSAVKAAELWVAKCTAKGSLTAKGVAFLVVALGFMVGGVAAEFWAKHWVTRKGAGHVIEDGWPQAHGGPSSNDQGHDFLFEPASSTTIATAQHGSTPPTHAAATLLAGGVRERERFLGANGNASDAGSGPGPGGGPAGAAGAPSVASAGTMGSAAGGATPTDGGAVSGSGNSEGTGLKPKET